MSPVNALSHRNPSPAIAATRKVMSPAIAQIKTRPVEVEAGDQAAAVVAAVATLAAEVKNATNVV